MHAYTHTIAETILSPQPRGFNSGSARCTIGTWRHPVQRSTAAFAETAAGMNAAISVWTLLHPTVANALMHFPMMLHPTTRRHAADMLS